MIISVRYLDAGNIRAEAVYDSGAIKSTTISADNRVAREITQWVDVGGVITVFDPYYGVSDSDIKKEKYSGNRIYADSEVYLAEHSPTQGVSMDDKDTDKENSKRNNRAKGKNKITDNDDVLVDHVDLVRDAQDNADDAVEAMNVRQDIIDFDPETWPYPTWTPPVA